MFDLIHSIILYINKEIDSEQFLDVVKILESNSPTALPENWPEKSRNFMKAATSSSKFVRQAIGLDTRFKYDLRSRIAVDVFMQVLLEIKLSMISEQKKE